MADLSSAKSKLARADQHIQVAKQVAETFLRSDFYKLATRPQKNGNNRHFVILKKLDSVPPEFGLAVGDAAHNLRSALDHIAYAFAKPASGEEKKVAFPLCSTRDEFQRRFDGWMPGVSRNVRTAVERLQPYHGNKWSNTKALGYIQAIDNWDKHRTMLVASVGSMPPTFNVSLRMPAPIVAHRVLAGKKALKQNAVIARFQLGHHAGTIETEMNVTCNLPCFPVFAEGMPRPLPKIAVMGLLNTASTFIRDSIIPTFEKL